MILEHVQTEFRECGEQFDVACGEVSEMHKLYQWLSSQGSEVQIDVSSMTDILPAAVMIDTWNQSSKPSQHSEPCISAIEMPYYLLFVQQSRERHVPQKEETEGEQDLSQKQRML